MCYSLYWFFFFKQKPAYEMRISDWSSDVCSSDLAYADFVTAMMAFFLLMWLLGATTEQQRKALADYFTPTLVEMKLQSAGSNGMFGGDSLTAKDSYPTTGGKGNRAITIPRDARSEEHTSELQSLMRNSYAVFR